MQLAAQDDPPEDHRIICDGCHEVRSQTEIPSASSTNDAFDRPFLERGTNVQHAPRRLTHSAWSVVPLHDTYHWLTSEQVCVLRGTLIHPP